MHIVIAEDDEDDAELIHLSFKKSGYFHTIDHVGNGVELLEFLNKTRLTPPHIILTDLNMPKKNGYEALQEISQDQDFCKIPVFVYSTTVNPSYVSRCKELGAKDFLIKPFNLEEIDGMPRRILEFFSHLVI